MDDLTSLKTSLVSEASNFVSLFSSKLEQTESDLETAAILESFWEVLDGEKGEDQESREFRMASTLQPSSLDLVPLLSPLLARPSPVKIAAEKLLLEGVGKFSSPREVMVAVGERLEALVEQAEAEEDDKGVNDANEAEKGEESAEEGSGDEEEEEEHDHSDPHHHHDHPSSSSSHPRYTPPSALTSELPTLLSLLASSIPRLTSKRSLPTFFNLASMLPPAMSSVPLRPATSRLVLDRLREVVEAARTWGMGTEDWSEKGEQRSILLGILASAFVHLYPGLDVPSANTSGWPDGIPNLIRLVLHLTPSITPSSPTLLPQTLLLLLSPSTPPTVQTCALLLLSWELFSSPSPQPHHFFNAVPAPFPATASLWLDMSVEQGLLSSAGAGGLGWVRGCVMAAIQEEPKGFAKPKPSEETIQTIFQTYLAPLASSPTPAQRQTIFNLLSTLLSSTFLPPNQALELVLPLMSKDSPLPMLRPAGLHFLRALIAESAKGGKGLGWLKEGGGLKKIGEGAWRLPFGEEGEEDIFVWDVDGDEEGEGWIRGPGPVFVVLALGVYQLVWGMDGKNESGIRSPSHLEQTKRVWLGPLRTRLDERRRLRAERVAAEDDEEDEEEEDESSGAWQAVEFALEGVEGVVKGLGRK
ncbi:hypothetical protein BDY24DRAFT_413172 [Mrakia frigida]|uniref:uncharacterized protein n=1 Tax=Mrakia frigida TaxID=29902 RepID=UPI003FCC14A6